MFMAASSAAAESLAVSTMDVGSIAHRLNRKQWNVMQSSNVPLYLALALASLAAVISTPSKGMNLEAQVVRMLVVIGAADGIRGNVDEQQRLALP
jgi:hypothetical protein